MPAAPRRTVRDDDLESLVRRARAGDERAWSVLVARFDRNVRDVARRHRLSGPDQDDVAQHTWLRLVRSIDRLRDPAALPGWLATAARNESLRLLASRREIPLARPADPDRGPAGPPDEHLQRVELRDAVRHALSELPPRQRTLMLTLIRDPALSYDEVSAALGLPRGSIGPTRQRSLARLGRDPGLRRAVGG